MFGRGRTDDEDPFAALKDGSYHSEPFSSPPLSSQPISRRPPSGAPAASPPPAYRTMSVGASGFSSGTRIVWRLFLVALVLVIVGVAAVTINRTVHSIKTPSFAFSSDGITGPNSGGSSGSGASPKAPRPVSYLSPRGLKVGLARIARLTHGAQLTLLRVDATTLSVYATRPNGATSHIYLSPAVTSLMPGPSPGERPISASAIRPNVLGALIAQLHRRFGVPARRIDYIVVSSPSGQPPQWVVFVRNHAHQGYIAPLGGGAWRAI